MRPRRRPSPSSSRTMITPFRSLRRRSANRSVLLALTGAGLFLASLDAYVVVTALLPMLRSVNIAVNRPEQATPIITGFLLGYLAVMPIAGGLSDRIGRLRLFAACLVLFAFGSFLTATAPSLSQLVTGRGLQGAGDGRTGAPDAFPLRRQPGAKPGGGGILLAGAPRPRVFRTLCLARTSNRAALDQRSPLSRFLVHRLGVDERHRGRGADGRPRLHSGARQRRLLDECERRGALALSADARHPDRRAPRRFSRAAAKKLPRCRGARPRPRGRWVSHAVRMERRLAQATPARPALHGGRRRVVPHRPGPRHRNRAAERGSARLSRRSGTRRLGVVPHHHAVGRDAGRLLPGGRVRAVGIPPPDRAPAAAAAWPEPELRDPIRHLHAQGEGGHLRRIPPDLPKHRRRT